MDRGVAVSLVLAGIVLAAGLGLVLTGDEGAGESTMSPDDSGTTDDVQPNASERFGSENVKSHVSALANESVVVEYVEDRRGPYVERTRAGVSMSEEPAAFINRSRYGTEHQYATDGTIYIKRSLGENVSYEANDMAAQNMQFWDYQAVIPLVGQFEYFYRSTEFERAGNVTRDGETFTRYVLAETPENPSENVTIQDGDGEILVDSEGIIHEATLNVTAEENGEPAQMTVEYRVTELGNVTVPEPAWLDEARSQTADGNGTQSTTSTSG